jgi:CRP/FNR family cyclic AMP-dependent transcriptional regulator
LPAVATKRAYIDHLRGVSLFSELSRRDLEKIASRSDVVDLPAGRVIMQQAQPGREAFVILKGSVSVRRNGRKVTVLQEGAMLGELSLLDHGPRTATATCDTDCTLLLLTDGALLGVVDEVHALSRKLFVSLAARIRDLDGRHYV